MFSHTLNEPIGFMLIDFDYLFQKYKIKSKGVLHIGAHEGQEAQAYQRNGIPVVCFIEANYVIYNRLREKVKNAPNIVVCILECVGDEDGKVVNFRITNNDGQSSSILDFGTHAIQHPDVHFINSQTLQTKTVKTIYEENHFQADAFDFLNIDIQGAELLALKGMHGILAHFKWLYLEVNKDHVYKDCALVEEIDDYVSQFGFERVETKWCDRWGDAFYKKNA